MPHACERPEKDKSRAKGKSLRNHSFSFLKNGEGVWGRGSFHFVFLFLLRSFFYGYSSGTVLWVSPWPRVRMLLRDKPR